MNIQRAREIAASPVMAAVFCDGIEVYIQHVDEQKLTARVFPLGETENEREVSLDQLEENLSAFE
ncbi:H-type small acid-soluble spore protein [Paenibacillus sp. CAA11]|uniref:H-type small acid-soluble spore protein n=1 Tax=Paenibacillus sp. CAA11 TaxID=1532905 RepID=UPI000D382761|nr:H-type small acid-soluble spore protein [Paenibacillus sp. CAA11]AWB44504.1 H-type small acid-soluble spore protein [Paenibacillus sp. CAA11]